MKTQLQSFLCDLLFLCDLQTFSKNINVIFSISDIVLVNINKVIVTEIKL